ncbi:MAG: serpin family protein [Ruminiclostridium sp.]
MKAKQIISGIAAVSTLITSLTIGGCQSAESQQSADLMENIKAAKHDTIKADDKFKEAYSDFSVELFKKSFSDNQNTLISPLSVTLALAMTANGANGQTKSEMETLLGKDIPLEQLNSYLCGLTDELTSDDGFTLCTANSIWFRDDEKLKIENDFLQTNADYYKAAAFKRPFDSSTCDEINKWVSDNTDGMVDKILDDIPYDAIMYLINAVSFDAEWESEYYEHQVRYADFTDANGNKTDVRMMSSDEHTYLYGENCTGFMKNYKGSEYSFAALLPNKDMNISDFISSLNGSELNRILSNAESCTVETKMPKFEYEYSAELNDALSALGMPTAFDESKADFSGIGKFSNGNIFIGRVIHKTKITVNEKGTKAGAATAVELVMSAAPLEDKSVTLDRPFVYMIIDNSTSLPLFIGAYTGI